MEYNISDFIRVGGPVQEPEQRTMEQTVMKDDSPIIVIQQDNTAVWVAGVIVPVIIAVIGWWLQSRWRKEHPNMPLTWENVKKSREK